MTSPSTIPALFMERAGRFAQTPWLWVKRTGQYHPMTWGECYQTVEALSAWLLQARVETGDRILLLSENRPAWGLADLAIQSVGAWTVPVYPSLKTPDVSCLARDCEPVGAIVSTAEQAQKIRELKPHASSLRFLVVMDPVTAEAPQEQAWAEAIRQGTQALPRMRDLLSRRRAQLRPEHTATIIYTSGTTGEPKGVMLSHQNFLSNAASCLRVLPIRTSDRLLSFLPLSHVFERMAGWYLAMMAGASIAYAESMDTIPQNMMDVRPTIMLGVPRFFEKLYARVQEGLAQAPPQRQRLVRWALAVGERAGACRLHRQPMPLSVRLQHAVADALVFRKLRQRLGGRLRFFVSGSAPLSPAIAEFFFRAGVLILEGYGLTETSPVIAVNRLDALKFGTVGLPIPDVEVRIAEDGEILTRGPLVMQGYYRKLHQTQAAIIDGWFHTGDIGHLDADGFLVITDRKKDLIKTAGGKFVAPQKLENRFVTDPYIAQAMVYGDRERYCVALIVPNMAKVLDYITAQGLAAMPPAELVKLPQVHQLLWGRVQALQQDLASFEQVKAIALLDQEFSQAAGELTPTMKAKRAAIAARYHDVLRRLYDAPS